MVKAKTTAAKVSGSSKAASIRKAQRPNYERYIHKIFKDVNPECSISNQTMLLMNELTHEWIDQVATWATKLQEYENVSTMNAKHVQTALKALCSPELAKHAMEEGIKAVQAYQVYGAAGVQAADAED
jgi:histone H2B